MLLNLISHKENAIMQSKSFFWSEKIVMQKSFNKQSDIKLNIAIVGASGLIGHKFYDSLFFSIIHYATLPLPHYS